MDLKDKKILYLLNANVRLTTKKIAQLIHSSREVVDYRIKRLQKQQLIKDYITLIDTSQFGYDNYLLLIELQNYSSQTEQEIIQKLQQHPFTKWLIKSSGAWDLQITVTAKDKHQLAKTIDEITQICGNHLRNYDLTLNINFLKQENLSFLLPESFPYQKSLSKSRKEISLDQKDHQLLQNIADNSKFQLLTLAKKIHLSTEATKTRLKRLENSQIITQYQAVIDLSKLNYLIYYLFLKFNTLDKQKEARLKTFCQHQKNITFVERIIGNWDVRLQIICPNAQEYQETLQKIREFFSEEIKYYHSSLLLQEHKRITYTKEMK